ncbi:glycosyltransferase [Vibrio halioticoli]|nr:glycosyltransferase [Vibrio halioticoli]
MSKTIAVIMSVYKSDNLYYFETALNSMLNQSYKCDIYIFIDGEIDKGILDIIYSYSKLDNVFYVKSNVNIGLAKALNNLIDLIIEHDYDYVARMDSDDISHSDRIEKQVGFLNENSDISVVGTACHEFGASFALDKKVLPTNHDDLRRFSVYRCPFVHPTVMFRSSIFNCGVRYPEDSPLTEDMALWFKLLDLGHRFSNINECLLDYRLNEDTLIRRGGFKKGIIEFKLRMKYMLKLKLISIKNILLISSRLVFHILPERVLKKMYMSR